MGCSPVGPYIDRQLVLDRDALQLQYVNLGYPTAIVDAAPGFSSDRTTAEPTFTVRLGPRILVDHVLIVGNVRTSTETIERELQIKPGDPLSEAAKIESRRRLAALGLFRRVQITELAHGDEGKRDVLVTVEESLATTVVVRRRRRRPAPRRFGAPRRRRASERLDVAPRGSFEISRRNLFGKNRSISLFTSVSVHLQNPDVFDRKRQPGGERAGRHHRVSRARHLPRAAGVRDGGRRDRHRHDRAAGAHQLQLRASRRRAPRWRES